MRLRALILCLFCLRITPAIAAPTTWMTLAPGFEYAKLAAAGPNTESYVHAFRIDPAKYRFSVALAKDFSQKSTSVRELAERSKALLAINGGFFSPELEPLGLRIQGGKIRSPLKNTSWWGVFAIHGHQPRIVAQRDFRPDTNPTMAVQAGPRLLVDGALPPLRPGTDDRSALGITPQGKVVVAITEHAPMETATLADLFRRTEKQGGLGCRSALNLDGGRSAQLFTRLGRFQLHIPNLSAITDAVVVLPK
ncbi:MAG: phosphodiester glycosidase family protein [Deltaproteobacteria bacterium]|nr:phosphodiester glycosidase family protein [Deltaproteobacteria bacterium]